MSNYYHWGATSSTWTSAPGERPKNELSPLKRLTKNYAEVVKTEPEKEKVEPVLFDPKDLVL